MMYECYYLSIIHSDCCIVMRSCSDSSVLDSNSRIRVVCKERFLKIEKTYILSLKCSSARPSAHNTSKRLHSFCRPLVFMCTDFAFVKQVRALIYIYIYIYILYIYTYIHINKNLNRLFMQLLK